MPAKITVDYKRARRDETCVAERKTWESRCGTFQVQEYKSKLEERTRYYALRKSEFMGWLMIHHMKTYRTRKAAERIIEKYIRSGSLLTKSERQLGSESRRRIEKPLLRKPRRSTNG